MNMTEPIDFLADTEGGQRSITITPVLITPVSGISYVTGQYYLTEGEVGIGTITFDTNSEWSFDGVTDLSDGIISQIAGFIKQLDHTPSGFMEEVTGAEQPKNDIAQEAGTLNFIVEDGGMPVDVHVAVNYPFYDVTVDGTVTAQLQQDHHSNWFVTNGHLNDGLVQAIGKRIAFKETGI
jgi:hypothetical protein